MDKALERDKNSRRAADSSRIHDAWKMEIEPFKKEDNVHGGPCVESEFEILYPQRREAYFRESWSLIEKALKEHNVKASLDATKGRIIVATTKNMWDPFIIFKARDLIKVIARGIPLEHASKVLDDQYAADVIDLKKFVKNRERFNKRRQRLVGKDGATLKALEHLTNCYVAVDGGTVAAVGPHKGLKYVRDIAEKCMKNIHPGHLVRRLMIFRELEANPALRNEDWSRFLPEVRRSNNTGGEPRKIPHGSKKRKERMYEPFPPERPETKVDQQLRTGEYFLSEKHKAKRRRLEQAEEQAEKTKIKKAEKEKLYEPPAEPVYSFGATSSQDTDVDVKKLKAKVNKHFVNN